MSAPDPPVVAHLYRPKRPVRERNHVSRPPVRNGRAQPRQVGGCVVLVSSWNMKVIGSPLRLGGQNVGVSLVPNMAHVVFALGAGPGLSQEEALELAKLLARKRSLAAQSASRKIRVEADRDPDRGEMSKDVELSREELEALEAVR